MFVTRVIVGLIIIPLVLLIILAGGWIFTVGVTLILGVAAWEFWRMVQRGGFKPSAFVLIAGVCAITLLRYSFGFYGSELAFTAAILVSMALAVRSMENGVPQPVNDFAINLAGLTYLGWIGSYFVAFRSLPQGEFWMLTALPAAWLADTGAYLVGVRFGRHKLCPKVSPKKSWEGYLGGIPFAILGTAGLAALWNSYGVPITAWQGALLGLIIAVLAPLGDLGESMLKRQFGVKDTSNILPGHGGVFDRIDSSLWAAVLGYYLITLFML